MAQVIDSAGRQSARQAVILRLASARAALFAGDAVDAATARLVNTGLERLEFYLTRRPVIAIVGEVNSGKTSVANVLTGLPVLPQGVVANTAVPVWVRHGLVPAVREPEMANGPGGIKMRLIEVALPAPRLSEFDILDMPAAPDATLAAAPGADIVVWTTVASRAWTAAERQTAERLPRRLAATSVIVATHADQLSEAERERVFQRLQRETHGRFTKVLLVDARDRGGISVGVTHEPAVGHAAFEATIDRLVAQVWRRKTERVQRTSRRLARLGLAALATAPDCHSKLENPDSDAFRLALALLDLVE
ncbi:MAG: dynamin family protein [Hyphomicrobiaceae bacterium]|nr:dynamin family protein [Hyphomicrobiaceae bacterium]